jgi:hypothetical protein
MSLSAGEDAATASEATAEKSRARPAKRTACYWLDYSVRLTINNHSSYRRDRRRDERNDAGRSLKPWFLTQWVVHV